MKANHPQEVEMIKSLSKKIMGVKSEYPRPLSSYEIEKLQKRPGYWNKYPQVTVGFS